MHIHIDTKDHLERERVIQLLQFALGGHREDIDSMHLVITTVHDRLGTRLSRCCLHAAMRHGQPVEVDELQSSLDLAVTRALERCVRRIQRRDIARRRSA